MRDTKQKNANREVCALLQLEKIQNGINALTKELTSISLL